MGATAPRAGSEPAPAVTARQSAAVQSLESSLTVLQSSPVSRSRRGRQSPGGPSVRQSAGGRTGWFSARLAPSDRSPAATGRDRPLGTTWPAPDARADLLFLGDSRRGPQVDGGPARMITSSTATVSPPDMAACRECIEAASRMPPREWVSVARDAERPISENLAVWSGSARMKLGTAAVIVLLQSFAVSA